MSHRKSYDPSPLASAICAGHYRKTDTSATRRAHGIQDWVLTYTLAGSGRFTRPARPDSILLTQPGMLTLFPPGTPQTMDIPPGGKFDHLWLHVLMRSHWLDWPLHPVGARTLLVPAGPVRQAIVPLFRRIVRLTMSAEPDRELFALNSEYP
jgi:hypothetical protein